MVSNDFRRQLDGYGLTTAQILYRLPDHPSLLQTYVWQDYDLCPKFPALNKFLGFWLEKLRGAAALGDGRAFAADQAGRDPGGERRVPAALSRNGERSSVREPTLRHPHFCRAMGSPVPFPISKSRPSAGEAPRVRALRSPLGSPCDRRAVRPARTRAPGWPRAAPSRRSTGRRSIAARLPGRRTPPVGVWRRARRGAFIP